MKELTIYHFMPDKLNLYSDIGNIIALKQRAKQRNITIHVEDINQTEGVTLENCDLFFSSSSNTNAESNAQRTSASNPRIK